MMKTRILGVVAAVVLFASASAVQADTITVTSGSLIGDNSTGALSLVSDQFDLTLQGFSSGIQTTAQMISPNMFQLNIALNGNFNGYGVVDGTIYPPASGGSGPISGQASLLFSTSPFSIPSSGATSVTTPFDLTGSLMLSAPGRALSSTLVSSGLLDLVASGLSETNGTFALNAIQLRFAGTTSGGGASPTPEPATMLLFGSGVLAVVGARKLRGRLA